MVKRLTAVVFIGMLLAVGCGTDEDPPTSIAERLVNACIAGLQDEPDFSEVSPEGICRCSSELITTNFSEVEMKQMSEAAAMSALVDSLGLCREVPPSP